MLSPSLQKIGRMPMLFLVFLQRLKLRLMIALSAMGETRQILSGGLTSRGQPGPGDDLAMHSEEDSEVGSSRSRSGRADFALQQAHAYDVLDSFVGSLVKGDVARYGLACSDQKLPWENDFARRLLDPDCEWDPLQESVIPPLFAAAPSEKPTKAATKEVQPGAVFAWAIS